MGMSEGEWVVKWEWMNMSGWNRECESRREFVYMCVHVLNEMCIKVNKDEVKRMKEQEGSWDDGMMNDVKSGDDSAN